VPDPDSDLRLTYVGHATVLLEGPGLRCLTDPFLRDRLGPLRRHGPTPDPDALGPLDLVLVSHAHPDHFDLRSLRRLHGDPLVIVPHGLGRAAQRAARHVRAVGIGDRVAVGRWTVTPVPARHLRWPFEARTRALGYLLEGPTSLYFAGDTGFYPGMADLAGRADVALLPIGRWGPHRGPGHLDPVTAARVADLIRARIVLPIHWGTLYPRGLDRAWRRPLDEPATVFAAAMATEAPASEPRVLLPGEATVVKIRAGGRSASATMPA
jgi:L-ascorbate metabolism protein UlaG (beta-lactamase superfamily)